jgi:hypothetical protein
MRKALDVYVVVAASILTIVLLSGFQINNTRFAEITVERINVVDENGQNRLVISNSSRMPGIIQRGEVLTANGGRTGMLFFNDEGTEAGGLIFSGKKVDGKVTAVGSLTFDQYEQDQTITLQYVDDNGTRRAGLNIVDRPTTASTKDMIERSQALNAMPEGPEKTAARQALWELRSRPRLYVGRSRDDGSSLVSLSDAEGRERLRVSVTLGGDTAIEFLDDTGNVLRRITAKDQ